MIQNLIDQSIKEANDKRNKDHVPSGKFKPSSFGFCFRRQWWEFKGEEKSNLPDARVLRIFKVGNIFEEWVVNEISKTAWTFQKQVLIEDEDFKGYADYVDSDSVTDFKTQHSRKFWHVKKEQEEKSIIDILSYNFLQAGFYALKLGKPFVRICLISKDDLCIDEFKVSVDKIKQRVAEEIHALVEIKLRETLPPPAPRLFGLDKQGNPKECGYCPYKDKCFELQKGKKE